LKALSDIQKGLKSPYFCGFISLFWFFVSYVFIFSPGSDDPVDPPYYRFALSIASSSVMMLLGVGAGGGAYAALASCILSAAVLYVCAAYKLGAYTVASRIAITGPGLFGISLVLAIISLGLVFLLAKRVQRFSFDLFVKYGLSMVGIWLLLSYLYLIL